MQADKLTRLWSNCEGRFKKKKKKIGQDKNLNFQTVFSLLCGKLLALLKLLKKRGLKTHSTPNKQILIKLLSHPDFTKCFPSA